MIFVTNDDGIEAPGLKSLAEALESLDEVYVVAPDRERSSVGMAITLHRPLRAKQVGARAYSVDGTPVDCVDLAVSALLPERPKLLVSGINQGENTGVDIHFSGTLAAAKKGTFLGIPSLAVSLALEQGEDAVPVEHYETAAVIAYRIAKLLLNPDLTPLPLPFGVSGRKVSLPSESLTEGKGRGAIGQVLPAQILLNVNVPNCPLSEIKGVKMTRQDLGGYSANAMTRLDRRGRPYYWIGGERAQVDFGEDTDLHAIRKQRVSITPVQLDFTAHALIEPLTAWLNDENMQL